VKQVTSALQNIRCTFHADAARTERDVAVVLKEPWRIDVVEPDRNNAKSTKLCLMVYGRIELLLYPSSRHGLLGQQQDNGSTIPDRFG
jgi:hypothetical protein